MPETLAAYAPKPRELYCMAVGARWTCKHAG